MFAVVLSVLQGVTQTKEPKEEIAATSVVVRVAAVVDLVFNCCVVD